MAVSAHLAEGGVPPPPHTHTLYIRIVVSRHDRQCDDRTALDTDRFMKAADTAPPPNMLNSRPNERTMSVPVCLSVPFTVYLGEPKEDACRRREDTGHYPVPVGPGCACQFLSVSGAELTGSQTFL